MFSLVLDSDTEPPEAARQTVAAYNEAAAEYAQATREYVSYPGLRQAVEDFANKAPGHLPVLDLGCGGGRDSALLADCGRHVVAGDLSETILATIPHASTNGTAMRVCLDIRALPLTDDSLGGVWACGSLLHLMRSEIDPALDDILRILASGGLAAINMQTGSAEGWRHGGTLPGRRWFTLVEPKPFIARMEAAGFVQTSYCHVGREGWFLAIGRKD